MAIGGRLAVLIQVDEREKFEVERKAEFVVRAILTLTLTFTLARRRTPHSAEWD
jgi:hypothetical protein